MRATVRGEDGVTLAELLVVMALLGVIGTVMLTGVVSSLRAADQVESEADALDEIRVAVERLGRDLREARLVDATSTAAGVVLWVDADADYRQAPDETLMWRLEPRGPDTYDLVRENEAGGRWVETLRFVTGVTFLYEPAAPDTRIVTVALAYRADRSPAGTNRTAEIEIRLRNVA